jgi:hypothetical protein
MPQIDAASCSGDIRDHGYRKIGAIGQAARELEAGEGGGRVKWAAGIQKRCAVSFFESRRQGDDGEGIWTKFWTCGGCS